MGNVSILDRNAEEVRTVLRKLLDACEAGEVTGAVIITEYQDRFDLDIPGTFSTEPDAVASIIGRLQIASNVFAHMTWADEDEDDD